MTIVQRNTGLNKTQRAWHVCYFVFECVSSTRLSIDICSSKKTTSFTNKTTCIYSFPLQRFPSLASCSREKILIVDVTTGKDTLSVSKYYLVLLRGKFFFSYPLNGPALILPAICDNARRPVRKSQSQLRVYAHRKTYGESYSLMIKKITT